MRPSTFLIYGAIAIIAGCTGASLMRFFPVGLDTAITASAAMFVVLALLEQANARQADRKQLRQQIEVQEAALQDAFNEVDMLRSRLVGLETDTQQTVDAGVAPLTHDVQAIGALLAQVTETVSDVDHRMIALETAQQAQEREARKAAAERPAPEPVEKPAAKAPEPKLEPEPQATQAEDSAEPAPEESAPTPRETAQDITNRKAKALLQRVATAVERQRIEVAMQSIVTLPQRRARGYATTYSLKLDGAGTLESNQVPPAAQAAGVTEEYARGVVTRAITLAERFAARESASIVFAPLNGASIGLSAFSGWLVETMTENKALAGRLVFEVPQADIRAFSPLDFDVMGSLSDLGFRMAVCDLSDARSDLFDLSSHGFRYAKAPVSLFLGSDAAQKSDIHPEDLSDLAARNGMDLIVTGVETEAQVVELLDCNLRYGQGNLFARPRVVDVPVAPPSRAERRGDAKSEDAAPDPEPRPGRSGRSRIARSA
ncbi:MAG: EAL domain-containing protein [Devosiaceae bacterium]|nr:EAL domain-containing protein [Devosiaceae bacterium MH13]